MQAHVEALYKKATDDQKYYNGAVDSLGVLQQEISKLEAQQKAEERKEAGGKSRKNSGPQREKEKVRAIRSSSKQG